MNSKEQKPFHSVFPYSDKWHVTKQPPPQKKQRISPCLAFTFFLKNSSVFIRLTAATLTVTITAVLSRCQGPHSTFPLHTSYNKSSSRAGGDRSLACSPNASSLLASLFTRMASHCYITVRGRKVCYCFVLLTKDFWSQRRCWFILFSNILYTVGSLKGFKE